MLDVIKSVKTVYESAGLKGKRLALALDKVYRKRVGFSALEAAELELTAAELGEYFGQTEQRVNEILAVAGYQHKINGKWEVLPPGEKYAFETDGQLRWSSRILCAFERQMDVCEKWYTAEEIGAELGISAEEVERIATEHGIKPPEGESNEYGMWVKLS